MGAEHMQIGEVAERTSLSLRTIRYYEEVGLIPPSTRSAGGFRLYTERDVERLSLVQRMKPLEFSLEEMRDLLATLDELEVASIRPPSELADRMSMYREIAEQRIETLREQLTSAEAFAEDLRRRERVAGQPPSGRRR